MADDAVWPEFGHGAFAIAEVDGDDRDTGRARGADVDGGIANHDRALRAASGGRDRAAQDFRIGLLNAEGILSADRLEAAGNFEFFEQQYR